MIQPATEKPNRMMKSLPAALAALFLAVAALPALAQGDGQSGIQGRGLEPVANGIERGSALLPAHTVRLGLPSALIGDENAQARKLSLELGYGQSLPPPVGLVPRTNLPEEFRGRSDQIAVKANITLSF